MARFLSAAVDKFRSDMVDFYLGSWFNHKKSNAVLVLRDGLAGPASMNIQHIEVQENRIILTFGLPRTVANLGEASGLAARPPTPGAASGGVAAPEAALFSLRDADDESDDETLYASMSRRNVRIRNMDPHGAYSAETVDSSSTGGIEMRPLPRTSFSLTRPVARGESRYASTQF